METYPQNPIKLPSKMLPLLSVSISWKMNDLKNIFQKMITHVAYENESTENIFIIYENVQISIVVKKKTIFID